MNIYCLSAKRRERKRQNWLAHPEDRRPSEDSAAAVVRYAFFDGPIDLDAFSHDDLAVFFAYGILTADEVVQSLDRLKASETILPLEQYLEEEIEASERDVAREARCAAALLRSIAFDTGKVANDLSPLAFDAFRQSNASELTATLSRIARDLQGARSMLQESRSSHLQKQLSRLGVSESSKNLKLHIGCGPPGRGRLKGWINIDLGGSELDVSLSWPLPFGDASVDLIFSAHVLEHLIPVSAVALLREARRVLAPGGRMRLVVPDLGALLKAYASDDKRFFGRRQELLHFTSACRTHLEQIVSYVGGSTSAGHFFDHKFGYDFETLRVVLDAAGFRNIEQSTFMKSANDELRVDNIAKAPTMECNGRHYSLFVEAW